MRRHAKKVPPSLPSSDVAKNLLRFLVSRATKLVSRNFRLTVRANIPCDYIECSVKFIDGRFVQLRCASDKWIECIVFVFGVCVTLTDFFMWLVKRMSAQNNIELAISVIHRMTFSCHYHHLHTDKVLI